MSKPICPDCHEAMVKALEQNEEGDWAYRWLCGCKAKVKQSFCPECEEIRDCKIIEETSEHEELDCLWCGQQFAVYGYAYTDEEKKRFIEMTR